MDTNPKNSGRAEADRELYDSISGHLARKDLMPAQRPARRQKLQQTFSLTHHEFDSVLEIGCGAGYASEYLEGKYKHYTGIDHSSENIKAAISRHQRPGVTFVNADIESYTTETIFDCAFLIGVLHHLEDPVASLRRIKKFVSPGGYILANEPQPGNPIITLARIIRKKTDKNYSADQVEFSISELETIFKDAGLQDVKITPQGFLSTPFSEITFPLQNLMTPVTKLACAIDRLLEKTPGVRYWGRWLSWNLVVSGRVPDQSD